MDAKVAIALAKNHVAEMFKDELTAPPTLEEIWLDDRRDEWFVTLGVRRPTNYVERDPFRLPAGGRTVPDYKVVQIANKDGKVASVRNRETV